MLLQLHRFNLREVSAIRIKHPHVDRAIEFLPGDQPPKINIPVNPSDDYIEKAELAYRLIQFFQNAKKDGWEFEFDFPAN